MMEALALVRTLGYPVAIQEVPVPPRYLCLPS